MGKFRELEVVTPVELVKPADFVGGVLGIWNNLTSKVDSQQPSIDNIRMWSTGETVRAIRPLSVVDPDKFVYFHYARVADKTSNEVEPFDFFNLATEIDAENHGQEKGENDLRDFAGNRLKAKLGRCTLDQMVFKFDRIDTVESTKYPGQQVFVLKRSPLVVETENRTKNASGGSIVEPLGEISRSASALVKTVAGSIHELETNPGIEDGVPFARTKETDAGLLDEFRSTVLDQLFDRHVELMAHPLDINWSL